jgi:hypothetical protein
MTMSGRVLCAASLVGALVLAACGGGNGTSHAPTQQPAPPVSLPPPGDAPAGAPVAADFIKLAQAANCSDIKNRLFMIDNKQVFWDRAGNCPDNSYGRTLFGASLAQIECISADSVSGPRTFCANDQSQALFDTILKHLDQPDLGLAGHKVEPIAIPPVM